MIACVSLTKEIKDLFIRVTYEPQLSHFPIFVHKYDLKHHKIFTQILKIDKENQIEQIRQNYYIWLFIHGGQ